MKPDKCPKCKSDIWGVEYSLMDANHYDGVSEWSCEHALGESPTCDYRIGRFCGQRLNPHMSEMPYCKGIHPVHA